MNARVFGRALFINPMSSRSETVEVRDDLIFFLFDYFISRKYKKKPFVFNAVLDGFYRVKMPSQTDCFPTGTDRFICLNSSENLYNLKTRLPKKEEKMEKFSFCLVFVLKFYRPISVFLKNRESYSFQFESVLLLGLILYFFCFWLVDDDDVEREMRKRG